VTFPFSLASLASQLPPDSALPDSRADLVQLVRVVGQRFGARWEKGWEPPAHGALGHLALRHRHAVLLLVDGLGDAFLQGRGAGSFLARHRLGALSSVFPSTTASAITSLMTGVAPIQHGLLGWFIRDRRFGGILAPLPLTLRAGGEVSGSLRLRRLFPYRTLFQRLSCRTTVVSPAEIVDSPFNRRHSRGAARLAYHRLEGLVTAVREAVMAHGPEGGYVYAYYPRFDALAHHHGVGSDRMAEEFARIDAAITLLAATLARIGVDLLVTADHGFIDVPPGQTQEIEVWPEIKPMLATPLWGERRAAWCAAKQGAEKDFEAALGERLGDGGVVLPTAGLASSGLLGTGRPSPRLAERMGTHLVVMAPGRALRDRVPGETEHPMIGLHGGLSADEMRVPLVHMDCN
jgi:type I phosphodiesterase/nucleotide pyrophosphatase